MHEKDYIWNPHTCACEINKHLKSIIGDIAVKFDEIIESTKITPITFNEKNANCRIENFHILLTFSLIIIELFIICIIYYCYYYCKISIETKTYFIISP